MKKRILYTVLFFCCTVVVTFAQKTIEVCASCETTTLTKAVETAQPFDTIKVKKGTYAEYNIGITKPLTIIGEGNPVIDGQNKGEIITIESDNVTVKGFTVVNVGTSYTTDFAAIRVVNSKNFVIENNTLKRLFFGIYLQKSNHGKVLNNTIQGDAVNEYNSGNGIQLWYCNHVEVAGNTVKNVRDGIYLEFSDQIEIHNNKSTDNLRYGLHFMFSNHDTYTNNLFENNGAGVAVMFSKFIKMYNNVFRKNWGTASFGLLLKEINDSEIEGNLFEENTVGINIEGSNRIEYKHNDFKSNGWAIKVRGACYANTFTKNNFLYNSFDVSYNSKINDNLFDKNYWSNYTGYDLDKNGIGDVPYRPVKLFSYIVNRTPETIILLRSLFIDIIDFSEKVSPVFTPDNLMDNHPLLKPTDHDRNR
ncbi:nitrous oxide reductase family maturation protein NosD [Marixanthomonas spongiae]|uniref:Nitrous oxide reductase family maturation protein NosD n=1 Tax=Marixanthomonas spongiae TaxID=2174845 RepID=A0A2U0I420_9FLAO|nr:nitrous oxide reductase family maturation protein NosD [Marixanthomonas spongiae]PVW15865.1 nitrous oxide reductase family maturation protein NosD [Marixanthomonas spongiae]